MNQHKIAKIIHELHPEFLFSDVWYREISFDPVKHQEISPRIFKEQVFREEGKLYNYFEEEIRRLS